MYYNSSKSNNDYYNSYKRQLSELEAYKKEETLQKIIKFFLLLLLLLLFVLGSYYLYIYFYPTLNIQRSISKNPQVLVEKESLNTIEIREEELPKSVQTNERCQTANSRLNEEEIALIVQIIMAQITAKKEIPLEEQLALVSQKKFETKSLKDSNHYNKIILPHNEIVNNQNDSLLELTNELNHVIDEYKENKFHSDYIEAVNKETTIRKNEMRVIIVQEGDTLSKIAKKAYGSANDYKKIFSANPEIIKNPDQIFVGQRLRIPA